MSDAKAASGTSRFSWDSKHRGHDYLLSDSDRLDNDEPVEKDEVEIELEKLVFGNKSGFQQGLISHGDNTSSQTLQDFEKIEEDDHTTEEEKAIHDVEDADLFFLDPNPSAVPIPDIIPRHGVNDDISLRGENEPAWVDSDDERIVVSLASNPRLRKLRVSESEDLIDGKEYTRRLRRQFERLYPVPEWAKQSASVTLHKKKRRRRSSASNSSENDSSMDDMLIDSDHLSVQPLTELLKGLGNLDQAPSQSHGFRKLRPEVIDMQRIKDVGQPQPSSVESLNFHPRHPLLLSSGPASTLFLHHISPYSANPNLLMTSLHVRSTPLKTSAFLPPDGSKIFFSGRRRYFHVWDLSTGAVSKISRIYGHKDEQRTMESFKLSPCGRWMGLIGSARKGGGVINVLDATSCQWIAEVRVEGKNGVAGFDWWGDGEGMVVIGTGGEAVEWDIRGKKVVGRWMDEGAVGTSTIALGGRGSGDTGLGGDRWVAVGSSSGIVNVYDRKTWKLQISGKPKPTRVFDQLTTPTSHLVFSPDGQILAIASRWKKDALRLVHLPSCTVYRNWPTSGTPLGRITAVAFTPGIGMLVVGNEQGKIRCWEIRG